MPLVCKPSAFTCRAERLARARTSPNGSIIRPSGKTKGVAPDSDASETMDLGVFAQFIRRDVLDGSLVHDARRYVSGFDQVAQPLRAVGVDLVVKGGHAASLSPGSGT
jgi:hypothetical protein